MKEARIILPIAPGTNAANDAVLGKLSKLFGGSTAWTGYGRWNEEIESVLIVDVAYSGEKADDNLLYAIADNYRQAAEQQSVYLRYGNGNVQMVTAQSHFDNRDFDWNSLVEDLNRPVDEDGSVAEVPEHVEYNVDKPDLDAAE